MRSRFQGLLNVVSFNRGHYVCALFLAIVLAVLAISSSGKVQIASVIGFAVLLLPVTSSLAVSHYVYDCSGLFDFSWLEEENFPQGCSRIINMNAGFDETSHLLEAQFPKSQIDVYDFFDPEAHTEASILRARKAYPPHPRSLRMKTDRVPLNNRCVDVVFAVFSLHEIRNNSERQVFFTELARVLKPGGSIVLIEHIRDFPNFMAYTVGCFHFLSKQTWLASIKGTGLQASKTRKLNPFVTALILTHDSTD